MRTPFSGVVARRSTIGGYPPTGVARHGPSCSGVPLDAVLCRIGPEVNPGARGGRSTARRRRGRRSRPPVGGAVVALLQREHLLVLALGGHHPEHRGAVPVAVED